MLPDGTPATEARPTRSDVHQIIRASVVGAMEPRISWTLVYRRRFQRSGDDDDRLAAEDFKTRLTLPTPRRNDGWIACSFGRKNHLGASQRRRCWAPAPYGPSSLSPNSMPPLRPWE